MGAPRRAAAAAALIGLGLALYRPRLVPELRPGPRASSPARPRAVLASPIAWPPAPPPAADPSSAAGGHVLAPRTAADEEAILWRDALAAMPRGFAARGASAPAASAGAFASHDARRAAPPVDEAGAGVFLAPLPAEAGRAGSGRLRAEPRPAAPAGGSAPAAPRRAPLALGPAGPADADAADDDVSGAVDQSPGERGPNAAAWARRSGRPFPLFKPPKRAARAGGRSAARPRVRPALLSKLLGREPLRPPPSSITPPDLTALKARKPALLPDGGPVPARAYELDRIEAHDPRAEPACRRRAPHWDAGPRWHDGAARGVVADARWLWLWKEETRWWAAREPEYAPLLRHRGLWWSKQRGVWFALHEGELWSWKRFSAWDAEGLIRLADGVELVYSADFTKVAVITPGEGAVLYDAATGAELGDWLESELPRRRPRPPAVLRLPRGI